MSYDPRLTPVSNFICADHLRKNIEHSHYVAGQLKQIRCGCVNLYAKPDSTSRLQTQLIFGEPFIVYKCEGEYAWGQAQSDGYVGWLALNALGSYLGRASHMLGVLRSYAFSAPDLKAPICETIHLNSMVLVEHNENDFAYCSDLGWVFIPHIRPIDRPGRDPAIFAQQFLHAPYLWGGRSSIGLDCSALTQLAMDACAIACPRDSDMQFNYLGEYRPDDAIANGLVRNDLVFWDGHVGLMLNSHDIIHANAFHMSVAIEPLEQAITRIGARHGPVIGVKQIAQKDIENTTIPVWLENCQGMR